MLVLRLRREGLAFAFCQQPSAAIKFHGADNGPYQQRLHAHTGEKQEDDGSDRRQAKEL